ncbi:MAG: 6-bladed beta-propeller [Terriglobia bacterium]|jgi:DNA-binding beta-propeller fold protein YncE
MRDRADRQTISSAGTQTGQSSYPSGPSARLPICPSAHLPICLLVLLLVPGLAAARSKANAAGPVTVPQIELEGGRTLRYEGSFSSEKEVKTKHSFWGRLLDVVAGEPEFHGLINPYSVVTDSRDRIIVTDPGAAGIHIFDFTQHKYKFISHQKSTDGMVSPQCVAVDAADNIYVTDSYAGKIFVFDAGGKFQRVLASVKGEGYFKRSTGIAVDSQAQRIYVADTLRHLIFVLDMDGKVLQKIGRGGTGEGQFNFPTELRLAGQDLLVVDAMNFRVQVLDRSGKFQYALGQVGDEVGAIFRPKGIGLDSEGHLYVVEGVRGQVQVFDRQGRLLYFFGQKGSGFGEFQLPTGLFIDSKDRVFVVDSFNRRVQVFQYVAQQSGAGGQVGR